MGLCTSAPLLSPLPSWAGWWARGREGGEQVDFRIDQLPPQGVCGPAKRGQLWSQKTAGTGDLTAIWGDGGPGEKGTMSFQGLRRLRGPAPQWKCGLELWRQVWPLNGPLLTFHESWLCDPGQEEQGHASTGAGEGRRRGGGHPSGQARPPLPQTRFRGPSVDPGRHLAPEGAL